MSGNDPRQTSKWTLRSFCFAPISAIEAVQLASLNPTCAMAAEVSGLRSGHSSFRKYTEGPAGQS
jgi:hypothetical protein